MQWVNDREVTKFLLAFVWPVSRKSEEEWLARATQSTGSSSDKVLVIEAKDGVYIGQVGLHGIDYVSGVAELGIVIGRKDYWGKGYGADAIRTLLRFAFSQLRLRKIILKYQGANERGRKCYSRVGFKEVGRLKAHQLVDGEFQDMVYTVSYTHLDVYKRQTKGLTHSKLDNMISEWLSKWGEIDGVVSW